MSSLIVCRLPVHSSLSLSLVNDTHRSHSLSSMNQDDIRYTVMSRARERTNCHLYSERESESESKKVKICIILPPPPPLSLSFTHSRLLSLSFPCLSLTHSTWPVSFYVRVTYSRSLFSCMCMSLTHELSLFFFLCRVLLSPLSILHVSRSQTR